MPCQNWPLQAAEKDFQRVGCCQKEAWAFQIFWLTFYLSGQGTGNSYLTNPLFEVVRVDGPGSLCQVRNQVLLQSLEPSCIKHLVCPRVWGHVKPCLPCPRSRLPAVEQKEKKPTRKAPGQAVAKKAASKAKAKVKAKAKATACSDN